MKKVLSAILAAALTLGLMAVPATAAEFDDGVEIYSDTNITEGVDSVVALSYFDASRSTSEAVRKEILMMNLDIDNLLGGDVYEAKQKLSDENYEGTLQIRSYTYESDKYLQIFASAIEFPTYGFDPNVYSWVYDRTAKKYVHLSDALREDDLTECDIIEDAEKLYVPQYEEYLFGGKVQGFVMQDDETRAYLLRMNNVNPEAEDWQTFMVYVPGKYTEDGKAVLYQNVTFEAVDIILETGEVSDTEHDNCLEYNVKYEDADGNYIRFMRDKYAVVKLGGEFTVLYHSLDKYLVPGKVIVMLNKGSALWEATLDNGTITLSYNDKDYTLTIAE